jgi:hypothetical protein
MMKHGNFICHDCEGEFSCAEAFPLGDIKICRGCLCIRLFREKRERKGGDQDGNQ